MSTIPTLILVSHRLCPYVQRVAIVLAEKQLPAQRRDIDLANKPDWFLAISPTGKTPVLLVDGVPIFESAAICEYLEDAYGPAMHPAAPLARARHRGWIEYASATLNTIGGLYNAASDAEFDNKATELEARFASIEAALQAPGGLTVHADGHAMTLLDAAFAPVFRYLDAIEQLDGLGFLARMPAVSRWRRALQARASVMHAVQTDYPDLLRAFLIARGTTLSRRLQAQERGIGEEKPDILSAPPTLLPTSERSL